MLIYVDEAALRAAACRQSHRYLCSSRPRYVHFVNVACPCESLGTVVFAGRASLCQRCLNRMRRVFAHKRLWSEGVQFPARLKEMNHGASSSSTSSEALLLIEIPPRAAGDPPCIRAAAWLPHARAGYDREARRNAHLLLTA